MRNTGTTLRKNFRQRAGRLCGIALIVIAAVALSAGCGGSAEQENSYMPELPTMAEKAGIRVAAIGDLPEDFIMGMDVSSVLAEEASGVIYYDENGEETDLFQILADSGINYIRVRVWVDPYDAEGHGYGGGNNDAEAAAEIGKRAAAYGMKLAVDFHYSDFWADPGKQYAPKAWETMTAEEKGQAIYDYTIESLTSISSAGARIGMVQIGNEINHGMAGEKEPKAVLALLQQASGAVREFDRDKDIKIVVHYTNPEDSESLLGQVKTLADAGLDYDVLGISYYSYWHGTMEHMQEVVRQIADEYGKQTCIMETAYPYTLEDGDGFANSVGSKDLTESYAATVQGQADNVRDVMAAASSAGALGVFYWEGAWVPIGPDTQANRVRWEMYGSGWASSYSAEYDPADAGKYYGGCAWDNQAMFDHEGRKLPSLDVFRYARYGADL